MARNICEIKVDPLFHLALSGDFIASTDPTHTVRNLAEIAVEAYENGVSDEMSSLPLASYELPWNNDVEATVSFSDNRLNGIVLRDRNYVQNSLLVANQPVLSATIVTRGPIDSRDLVIVSEPSPVDRSLSSRSYRIVESYDESEMADISHDLAQDARRFFVNHQAFRLCMELDMANVPKLKAV